MAALSDSPYLIPAALTINEEEIKKSRFITYLAPCASADSAKAFVREMKEMHPTARHHCWAFIAGRPEDSMNYGFSDDGEPSGTAGKPILAQLVGSRVGEIVAVVVRYYGGIQLGTGGLVKAYGGGVQAALNLLSLREKIITTRRQIHCDYSLFALFESIMANYGAIAVQSKFTDAIDMIIEIDARQVDDFTTEVINRFSAKVLVQKIENSPS